MFCTENVVRYCNIDETQIFNTLSHKGALSLFHTNICPLPKNIEEVEYLIEKAKIGFHVIVISESRIT